MKKTSILAVILAALAFTSCQKDFKKVDLENNVDSVSYAIGLNVGQNLVKNNTGELNYDAFLRGIHDMLQNDSTKLMEDDMAMSLMREYFMARFEEENKKNEDKANQWLENNKSKNGIQSLPSGCQYRVIANGDGPKPSDTSTVLVHYTARLIDGTVFDDSRQRGEPAQFKLDEMIPGWKELVPMMAKGAKWELFIPPQMGYGPQGTGDGTIPGNAVLIFDVELIDILK